jgi:hypothetical protein
VTKKTCCSARISLRSQDFPTRRAKIFSSIAQFEQSSKKYLAEKRLRRPECATFSIAIALR